MEPLVTLVAVGVAAFVVCLVRGTPAAPLQAAVRTGLAAMFLLTGFVHFAFLRADLVAMVPPWLPAPELLVTLTGLAEWAGAIGLLIPRLRLLAAGGLALLLAVMFPANVHLALTGENLPWWDELPWRTAMQAVFFAAAVTVLVGEVRRRSVQRESGGVKQESSGAK
ncbi:hypothetical protein G3I59_10895 [Amycolatopsis rubida]|uniref:DoxX family membrane protein n=1 Tax=Amycolatopsis rubida TaxID=112413 RepID=A0ABX0BPR5_9PSEU|nr:MULTISPECIES: DoxX family protein [Amycolatopsis]MYW91097.1 hypothetical protein [Amycolatopsis rubida]NEC56082.1 hypothetical protein [Amycolatopsis rubida]OAP26312.1 hypothetical protein A4R44_02299 [Amycolatopsis sp. M39]